MKTKKAEGNITRSGEILRDENSNEIAIPFEKQKSKCNSISEKSELNIDYTYDIVNETYINICVHIFVDSSTLAHPYDYMKSYVYNIKKKKLMTIKDILEESDLQKFTSLVTTALIQNYSECILLDELKNRVTAKYESFELFTFDTETITIYFNPGEITASYCDIVSVEIPISKFNIKIELEKEKRKSVSKEIDIQTKQEAILSGHIELFSAYYLS